MSHSIKRDVESLNMQYGDNFGTKLIIGVIIIDLVFAFICVGIMQFIRYKDCNKEYVLDSNKFIVSVIESDFDRFYEIDFDKNEIIKRTTNRERIKKVKTDYDRLKTILYSVMEDEENMIFTDEEKTALYKQNQYHFYLITDYKNNNYYVKDAKILDELKKILN